MIKNFGLVKIDISEQEHYLQTFIFRIRFFIFTNESEYKKSDAKYKRLEVMFLLTNVYFYETKVFNHQNYDDQKINFKTISISTFRNKKFQIDFEKTVTVP